MSNPYVERLRRLPQRIDETWQAALVRMPMWATDDDGTPVRPLAAMCLSTRTGLLGNAPIVAQVEAPPQLILESIVSFATGKEGGYRPGRLEVNEDAIAAELALLLESVGVNVVTRSALQALDKAVHHMRKHFRAASGEPVALNVVGVTIEHLRGFAEAAKEFHEAAPWRYLSEDDLIEIAAPTVGGAMQLATVLATGASDYAIAFFDSRRQFDRMIEQNELLMSRAGRGVWSVTFVENYLLPVSDADIWEDHGLAVANDDAYPFFARLGPGDTMKRPSPAQWVFVEGLMRAIARSSESEMDRGRWSVNVPTLEGQAEYVLTLPALLEPVEVGPPRPAQGLPNRYAIDRMLDDFQRATGDRTFSSPEEFDRHLKSKFLGKLVPHQAPRTPTERGQDLVGAAADARGRRQLQILREALKVWPDCADAYVMMAERTPDAPAARALYAQGMAAGERALGDHAIEECAGEFWSVFEARPYMRARFGFAQCCEWSGQLEEATGHYEELLRLNPSDNQGARYQLAVCLFRLKRFDRLEALLARYPEQSAQWLYVSALASFVRSGDNAESRSRLAAAYQCNRRVRKFLLGNADLPEDQPDSFRIGSEDEAVIVACELIDDWQAAAGAVAWLKAQTQTTTKRRKKRRRK